MRLLVSIASIASCLLLSACLSKGPNPDDPYESINRKTHNFNMAFDATALKPAAKFYKLVIPAPIRSGVNNAYNNVNMLPTIANDLLQAEGNQAIKDTWRFIANSTIGVAGIIDVATSFGLPPHSNDLGLTFAKWGDKKSPYIVIPFLGPSTIRDGAGMLFDYTLFTPYPYIPTGYGFYGVLVLRYIDLRSQMLETDRLIAEALDKYSFIRDAYLQHRNYLITGEQQQQQNVDSLYVDDDSSDDKKQPKPAPSQGQKPEFPLTTSMNEPSVTNDKNT